MIESIMLIAIGFLLGGLANLVFMPIVHNRAVRLTGRQLEPHLSQSRIEVQAHKDLLTAQFAMATRRAELTIEDLTGRIAQHLVELGKRSDALNRLKIEKQALDSEVVVLKNELAKARDSEQGKSQVIPYRIGWRVTHTPLMRAARRRLSAS